MNKKQKLCVCMGSVLLLLLLLNIFESLLNEHGIELRTNAEVIKEIYVWGLVPLICLICGYMLIKDFFYTRKGGKILLNTLMAAAMLIWLAAGCVRGVFYIFTEMKEEAAVEGEEQMIRVTNDTFDGSYYEYYEVVDSLFRKPFQGFSQEELISKVKEKYGEDATYLGMQGALYQFSCQISEPVQEEMTFLVKNEYDLPSNYLKQLCYQLQKDFWKGRYNRYITWEEESNQQFGEEYRMVLPLYSRDDIDLLCGQILEWVQFGMSNETLRENDRLLRKICIRYYGSRREYYNELYYMGELQADDNVSLYNYLYETMNEWVDNDYAEAMSEGSDAMPEGEAAGTWGDGANGDSSDTQTSDDDIEDGFRFSSEEYKDYLLSLEPDSIYQMENGPEYRMVAVDRAAGSSFFVLYATEDGKSISFINPDPFCGSGGVSTWITFIDGQLGFAGLSYSGGSLGLLYRTEDGGKSFTYVEYPSSNCKLPDGSLYNPFVMPESVYRKDGKLYMEAGQGPDGDYHNQGKHPSGIYESVDDGKTWKFLKEE